MILLFSILFALTVGLAVAGVMLERSGAGARALAQRLGRIGRSEDPIDAGYDAARDLRYSTIHWLDRALKSFNIGGHLELLLYQAGIDMRGGMLVLLMAAFGMGGYLLGVMSSHRLFPGLVLMLVLAPAPYLFVRMKKAQRMKAFRDAFPDALDLLVGGLRAGLSFTAALQVVSEESPEPLRSEFAITIEEQALGLDMRESLVNLTNRVDVLDLKFFVTAVLLQRETGGNLAEVLTNSAALIRDRFRVLGDIQTFTAQGKMTAVILVCLPIMVGVMTFMLSPTYFKPMIETEGGRQALWFAGGMQALGCWVIYKIVNIRV